MTTLGEKLREAIDKKVHEEVIKRTLNAWDTHEDQIRKPQQEKQMANPNPVVNVAPNKKGFGVSNNVVRVTFETIRDNPHHTAPEYVEMLAKKGFKASSTSSLIYQLIRTHQVHRDDEKRLSVTSDEYTPISYKTQKQLRNKEAIEPPTQQDKRKVVIVKRRTTEDTVQGIAALKADSGEDRVIGMSPALGASYKAFHPSAIVDNLSVLHARELYDYLKKIFTGESK